jgi:hypothetical protein
MRPSQEPPIFADRDESARRSRANRKKALEICQLIREADFPRDWARSHRKKALENSVTENA